jgi:uncharacterized surface anchored protein
MSRTWDNVFDVIEWVDKTRVVSAKAQFSNDVRSVEATGRLVHFHIVDVHVVLLEANTRSEMDVTGNLVHFQVSVDSAAFVLLFLDLL